MSPPSKPDHATSAPPPADKIVPKNKSSNEPGYSVVKNLLYEATVEMVEQEFSKFGAIKSGGIKVKKCQLDRFYGLSPCGCYRLPAPPPERLDRALVVRAQRRHSRRLVIAPRRRLQVPRLPRLPESLFLSLRSAAIPATRYSPRGATSSAIPSAAASTTRGACRASRSRASILRVCGEQSTPTADD